MRKVIERILGEYIKVSRETHSNEKKGAAGIWVCCHCHPHPHRRDVRPGKEDPDGGDECVSAGNPKALGTQAHL